MTDAMPSWEDIVEWVTISSNHLAVTYAQSQWQEALEQSNQTVNWLEELSRKNAQSWKGPGAEAFRQHLRELVEAVKADSEQHRRTARGLKRCADALVLAVRTIPVPSWQYEQVKALQTDFVTHGVPANIQPHSFWQTLIGPDPQGWPASALMKAEEFFRSAQQRAQAAYRRLCEEYRLAAEDMPAGTVVPVPGVNKGAGTGAGRTARTTGTGQPASALSSPPSTLPTAQTPLPPATTPATDLPPLDTPPVTAPDLPGVDTPLPDTGFDPGGSGLDDGRLGTSLAGAGGGGGLGGGIGGGAGGLGKGLGSIASLGTPGMGPAATPPPAVMAARLAAGPGGPGTAPPFLPMTPMAGGGHPGAADATDATRAGKLQEDEDIFLAPPASSGVIDV
ncbi:hypothetical protein [Phytohabitans suffuscus]|uniref:PPE family domain-containing protein n=1 Tax=Phytohabitans suffuscus TaxID=624315 RepID=A0A6F8YQ49_9ACTN|nr:hypothetical protein [Phytohabitans suffuscus]BCB88305.1 hypothetical protein Psuf_056180 [Phytohabitans suffuscus]